jgi:hypothetical protein
VNKIVRQTHLLLNSNTYLYENLNSDSTSKAFPSVFIILFLAETYVSAIKGYLDIPHLRSAELHHNSVTGIMGLCGTVVSLLCTSVDDYAQLTM